MKKGSITVFLSLSLAGVMLFTFLLLDLSRLAGQREKADAISEIAAMSVFADYNRYLWDTYGILAVDASYGTGSGADFAVMESGMRRYLEINGLSPDVKGRELYELTTKECKVEKYGFLTDQNGRAFLKQAAIQQSYGLASQAVSRIVDTNDSVQKDSEISMNVDEMLAAGNDAIKESENQETSDGEEPQEDVDPETARKAEKAQNQMKDITDWMDSGVLSQVLPSSEPVSDKEIDMTNAVSKRTLSCGNNGTVPELTAAERALFSDYEKNHFSCYRNDLGHDGLKYEWEYVICGKDSDKKNLSATVKRLIGIREVENLISIRNDPYKMEQAEILAAGIAGIVGNLLIEQPVKWGLIASWAYMESVLDVRLLLSGGKVPLVKSRADWTTNDLEELSGFFDVNRKAKDTGHGIDYEGYLLTMSALQTEKTLGLRSLDIMENSLKLHKHYENAALDQMIVSAEFEFRYSSAPAFFSLFALSSEQFPVLEIHQNKKYDYLDIQEAG